MVIQKFKNLKITNYKLLITSTDTSRKGFTLIEVVISLAIFGILVGLTFFGYTDYRKKNVLKLGAEQVKSALDECQNRALTPEKESGYTPKAYFLQVLAGDNSINMQMLATDDITTVQLTVGQLLPTNVKFSDAFGYPALTPDSAGDNQGDIKFLVPQTIPNGKEITFDNYYVSNPELQVTGGIGTITLRYGGENLYIDITINCYTGKMDIGQVYS